MAKRYTRIPLIDRFMRHVSPDPNTGCWLFTGADRNGDGYGAFNVGDKSEGTYRLRSAHRVSYEIFVGPIPEGLHLDHLCRVRCCVNPAHLEPVTCRENLRRGIGTGSGVVADKDTAARRGNVAAKRAITHCPRGHEYDEENTYHHPNGTRHCRACYRERYREKKQSH